MDERKTTSRPAIDGAAARAGRFAASGHLRGLVAALVAAAALLWPGSREGSYLRAAVPGSAPGPRPAARPGPATCPLFLLRRDGAGLRLDVDGLAAGSIEAFPLGDRSGIVAVLLPPVEGVQRRAFRAHPGPGAAATVHCGDGWVSITYLDEHLGATRTPRVSLADLRRSQVRITVLGDGVLLGYLLREGRTLARDPLVPPVLPERAAAALGPDRIVVASDARTRGPGVVEGTVPIRGVGPYLTGTLSVPGGGTGEAILDLGANRTTLSTLILAMASGARMTPAALRLPHLRRDRGTRALGGELSRVNAIQVAGLRVGGVDFRDAAVDVLDDLPALERHSFAGVVGTDLLGRADVVRIHMPTATRDGSLELLSEEEARRSRSRARAEVPFVEMAGLIVIPGVVGGHTVPLVLDTGSPTTLVTPELASDLGMFPVTGQPTMLSGLDGAAIPAWPDTLKALDLGGARFEAIPAAVAVLPVLERIGLPARSILLGQSFLGQLETLEVDWLAGVVRFYR